MLAFPASNWRSLLSPMSTASKSTRSTSFGRAASLILPRLYLSDYLSAQDEKTLSALGITHIVSVLERPPTLPESIPVEHRLHIPIIDRSDVDILSYLEGTTVFIRRALDESEDNTVLVHCFQGISRSATVVCAYVIATAESSITASEALLFVQAKRGIVCPNLGFRNQLETYATRFVGRRGKTEAGKDNRISAGIAERVRRLRVKSSPESQLRREQKAAEVCDDSMV